MAGQLAGPGQGLPFPQALYPATLNNGETVPPTNLITLAPGQQLPLPRGNMWVDLGGYAVLQEYDPVMGVWRGHASSRSSPQLVTGSDGFNFRVANLTGCAIGAVVTNGGSSYVQGSTTVTPAAGNSTWYPIVGGAISTTISVVTAGTGYTVPPMVFIAAPPNPGVPATAIAVLSSGTVSSITVINQGAGYPTAPAVSIVPNPYDPALASGAITSGATATTTLVASGAVTAVLCTNAGASFATVPSLTIAGAGTSAAATIVPMWTLTALSITNGGAGYTTQGVISTVGGVPSATPTYTNPDSQFVGYIPRPAQVGIAAASGGTITTIGTIYDGGLFTGTPTAYAAPGSTPATFGVTLGSVNATVRLQPAG